MAEEAKTGKENMDIDAVIRERFDLPDIDVRTCPPLTLAYIGDAVYGLVIRSIVLGDGKGKVNTLHRHTSHLVKAASQSEMLEYLFPVMTKEEYAVYKRGRNAKSFTKAKNATIVEYRRATGFEAVMGYLYLTDSFDRLMELVDIGLKGLKEKEKSETEKISGKK